jgi:hypothetical protein
MQSSALIVRVEGIIVYAVKCIDCEG